MSQPLAPVMWSSFIFFFFFILFHIFLANTITRCQPWFSFSSPANDLPEFRFSSSPSISSTPYFWQFGGGAKGEGREAFYPYIAHFHHSRKVGNGQEHESSTWIPLSPPPPPRTVLLTMGRSNELLPREARRTAPAEWGATDSKASKGRPGLDLA